MNQVWKLLRAVMCAKPGTLPPPDGEFAVGTREIICTDTSRTGLFREGEPRAVPMQLWYPAIAGSGAKATFLPEKGAAKRFAKSMGLPPIMNKLAKLPTNSTQNAPWAGNGPYPVLFFSHGYGSFYGQNTQQMEHLASHGYVVVSVGHPYECFWPAGGKNQAGIDEMKAAMKETGGKSDTPEAMRYLMNHCPTMIRSAEIWADDMSFAADWLESSELGGLLDLKRFGVFGHSFGGAAAGEISLRDKRCSCFVNLDGALFCNLAQRCTDVPFMLLTSENQVASGLCPEQSGYLHVVIPDARHFDFSDLPLAIPSFKKSGLLGSIDPVLMQRIVNDWLLAFFDFHLRGIPMPKDISERWRGAAIVKDVPAQREEIN